ncbi:quinone oxidoreductase [Spirochaetota bacterium]|nr:quinone oxidoreductase [Spirochaetota bacterium]
MMRMKAIQITEYGDVGCLRLAEDAKIPQPTDEEVLIKVDYAGVNFIDVYYRKGIYAGNLFPLTLGQEGMGTITQVGNHVTSFKVGDRVVFLMGGSGSYAEFATAHKDKLLKIPDDIEATTATALGIQGLTAHYLTHDTYRLQAGNVALIHAAAGGTGQLLTQMAKASQATVIATVSNEDKRNLALAAGADHVIIYKDYQFLAELKTLLSGDLVDVVYDAIGQATFEQSINSLKPRGMLVMYGQASGKVPPFEILTLSQKGSLFLTRPTLLHYMLTESERSNRARDLFTMIRNQNLNVKIDKVFPLTEAAAAQSYLEARKTMGKILLKIATS